MAPDAIVFACANPIPEIMPDEDLAFARKVERTAAPEGAKAVRSVEGGLPVWGLPARALAWRALSAHARALAIADMSLCARTHLL